MRPLSFALVSVINAHHGFAQNKDLNGGLGTTDDYQGSWLTNLLNRIKSDHVRLPVISFAYLQGVLKTTGHNVKFFDGTFPDPHSAFDVVLVYGSMVDHENEDRAAGTLKRMFPSARVGFFGPFPAIDPERFSHADFIIGGEAESFFMNDFRSVEQLSGTVKVSGLTDYDQLPSPDLDGFQIRKYGYAPALLAKPFISLQASKGCPFSCSYYCAYGAVQGGKIRSRSPRKVVDDIKLVRNKYGIKGILFRDPIFGLDKDFIVEFCRLLTEEKVKVLWGAETRLDHLTPELLDIMFASGFRLINIGVETSDPDVAKQNRRKLVEGNHQENIVRYCYKKGIKVSAFYILGMESDSVASIEKTIDYAVFLNTYLARFSVITPCPGTKFFERLQSEGRLLTDDFQRYSQFKLVFKHDNLSPADIESLLKRAYHKYYFRPSYCLVLLRYLAALLRHGG